MSKQHVVSLRIFDSIMRLVAIPVVQQGRGDKLINAKLPCGSYTAFWNGNYDANGKKAASGVYVYQLEVDGRKLPIMKMTVAK